MSEQMDHTRTETLITISAPSPPAGDAPTINIGQISARLGFKVTREFLHYLGFNGVSVGGLHAFLESDLLEIIDAIIERLEHLRAVYVPCSTKESK